MTRIEELTNATAELAIALSKEVTRRRMAERTLAHESKALREAFREVEALKRENKRLRDDVDITCDAIKARVKDVATLRELNANQRETICSQDKLLNERLAQIKAIRLVAMPGFYRKQIQAILEAK